MSSQSSTVPASPASPPPGWYDDGRGQMRWWDGQVWGQAAPAPQSHGPMTHSELNVRREVVYTRPQRGHSLTLWVLLTVFTAGLASPWLIYYSVSPNHYWHA